MARHNTDGSASRPSGGRYPGEVNPRYRRMVIPGALVGLILIVAVAALVRG
jgi:hypothetical protein